MREFLVSLLFLFLFSCIPLSIAPKIETDELVKTKRFKRDLPRNYGLVFEDPKAADEFYNFINAKYDLRFIDVESNVPFEIDENNYFLSFYEREKVTKTLNLIPIAVDASLESKGNNPMLEDVHTSRTGQWYLVLIVTDDEMKDCLHPDYKSHVKVIEYLRKLKEEYLTTHNYIESYLNRNN